MSAVDGWALVVYQGAGAVMFRVGGIVPGGGVPGRGNGLAGELEGDGALDALQPAVPAAVQVTGVQVTDRSGTWFIPAIGRPGMLGAS
jgi:hypothetical protein